MIKVAKLSQQDQAWQDIFTEAVEGRARLIKEFEKTGDAKVDEKLYKKYMKFLLVLFSGKCAYCETDIVSNQPGDVEHFRPKGRVVDDNFKPVRVKYRRWGENDQL